MNRDVQSRPRRIAYWVITVAAALLFAVPGVGDIVGLPHFAAEAARLGYPSYFLPFLGVCKVLGAIAILLPGSGRLKEWAYAGMIIDICGALVSRLAVGDGALLLVPPCVIAALVIASWAFRPSARW